MEPRHTSPSLQFNASARCGSQAPKDSLLPHTSSASPKFSERWMANETWTEVVVAVVVDDDDAEAASKREEDRDDEDRRPSDPEE